MQEKFFVSEQFSKKQARQEIKEEIAEYLASPKSKEGMSTELADSFEDERSKQPLNRKEMEEEIESFVSRNFEILLPILLSEEQKSNFELMQYFGLTSKDSGLLYQRTRW